MNSFYISVFYITVPSVKITNIFDIFTRSQASNTVFLAIIALFIIDMNRIILVAAFFAFMISSEVVISVLTADSIQVCTNDTTGDGETEKDSEEKSEDNNKIELLVNYSVEKDYSLSKSLMYPQKTFFTNPYLDLATPPPEVQLNPRFRCIFS